MEVTQGEVTFQAGIAAAAVEFSHHQRLTAYGTFVDYRIHNRLSKKMDSYIEIQS